MSYKSISIREAVNNINITWFLPNTQRPYVWGERHQKERFICKLFDSLLRRYPIGALLVWPTKKPIPYRNFLNDFDSENLTKITPEGTWGKKDKCLLYDGQQRLQSLYSCLKYTFHGKVLYFNLLFNADSCDRNDEEMGFKLLKPKENTAPEYLDMIELFACLPKEEPEFEERVLGRLEDFSKEDIIIVKKNLKTLWNTFVEKEIKLLAYYEIDEEVLNEKDVNDIFVRLNTTGISLSNSDILFSQIKRFVFNFEEKVWNTSKKIKAQTQGYSFSPDNILQTIFLIKQGTVRVDRDKIKDDELKDFDNIWSELEGPLKSFFYDFLFGLFRINDRRIIPQNRLLLPLISYFYYVKKNYNLKFKNYSGRSLSDLKKYFIISQFRDWNLQAYIDNFHRIIHEETQTNPSFPLKKIINFVKDDGRRETQLDSDCLCCFHEWFSLKILTPERPYSFDKDASRFDPEIDHIFPQAPPNKDKYPKKYFKWVVQLWNLQPVKGEINNLKRNTPPKQFFEQYPQFMNYYDHLPSTNINNQLWLDQKAPEFIKKRMEKMIRFMRSEYGLKVKY